MQTFTNATPKLGYSIREACQASSLGRTTIYNHIAAGRLRVTRVGGRTIIPAENLRALITGDVAADTAK
jgi:excisionase family DNA binding protein